MLQFVVLIQAFAMIRDRHDQRVSIEALLLQLAQQTPDLRIHERDLVGVGSWRRAVGEPL